MSQTNRVYNFLRKNKRGTASQIAKSTRVPRDSARKRVYDLRVEGYRIGTEVERGRVYYRFVG